MDSFLYRRIAGSNSNVNGGMYMASIQVFACELPFMQ